MARGDACARLTRIYELRAEEQHQLQAAAAAATAKREHAPFALIDPPLAMIDVLRMSSLIGAQEIF